MTVSSAVRAPRGLAGLGSWVNRLMVDYPWFDEYDLAEMIEEKTGLRIAEDDFLAVRSHYLRSKLRAWSPLPPEEVDE